MLSLFSRPCLLPAADPRGGRGAGGGVTVGVFQVVAADVLLGVFGLGARARLRPARRRSLTAWLR